MPLNLHTINRYPADLPTTPLVPIQLSGEEPVIWCKLEFLNPSGSTKDRIRATSSAMRSKTAN